MPLEDFPPDAVPEVEDLLLALFDGPQLLRFMRRVGGESLVHQLPAATLPPQQLAHEAALALDRSGLINALLFQRIAAERPGQIVRINETAMTLGVPVATAAHTPPSGAGVPDRIVDDTYTALRAQRELVRTFLGGPLAEWVRCCAQMPGSDSPERKATGLAVRTWIDAHLPHVTDPELGAALVFWHGRAGALVLPDGWGLVVAVLDEPGRLAAAKHRAVLDQWAAYSEAQLYRRAIELVAALS